MSYECIDCGEPATRTAKHYTGPDTFDLEPVCQDCWTVRDNYEPPDDDPEVHAAREQHLRETLRDAGRIR